MRFNTIATAFKFKKSRENIIPLNNQEHVERITKLHNANRLKETESV